MKALFTLFCGLAALIATLETMTTAAKPQQPAPQVTPAVIDIRFFTHSVGKQTYQDNQGDLRGFPHTGKRAFNIELVRKLMFATHHPHQHIEAVPLKRMVHSLQNNKLTAGFNLARTPIRERRYHWVGPLQTDNVYFYQLSPDEQNLPRYRNLQQARNSIGICVVNGGHYLRFLKKEKFTNIIISNSYQSCFQMLISGRVELAVLSDLSLSAVLKASKIDPQRIEPAFLMYQIHGHIAFSRDTPVQLIKNWQNALDKMKKNGEYQTLVQRYLLPENTSE